MSAGYNNARTWHGLPPSGRKRARGDMGQYGGQGVKTTPKVEISKIPSAQRSLRQTGRPVIDPLSAS